MSTTNTQDLVLKALDRAFVMGQNYWADADSESWKANKRSDVTREKFRAMRDEVCAALQSAAAQPQGGEPRCECNATTDQLCEVCTAHRDLPAQPPGDAREAFEALVKKYTGRDMDYHARNGTTGLDFAWIAWQAASTQASEPSAASTDDRAQACRIAAEADKYLRYNRTHLGQLIYVSDLVWALGVLSRAAPARAVEPMTITEDAAWNLAKYVYAHSNPHESPQILLSAMEIKQIIERAHGTPATTPTKTQGGEA